MAAVGRPRWRGGGSAAVAPESEGEEVWEDEELAGKLTAGSNRAEDGRRGEFNGEGEASGADDDGGGGPILAG